MIEYTAPSSHYGLEDHLKILSSLTREGETLNGLWANHKILLSQRLSPVSPIFFPYSDHSASHSQTIVSNINRLLGKERIGQLSATDTWLLLECAYRHDLGMHVTFDEKRCFVESNEFNKMLTNTDDFDKDERHAARKLIDDVKPLLEEKLSKRYGLIIEYGKYLDIVLARYYRLNHAHRSDSLVKNERVASLIPPDDIPDRLWDIIGIICKGHTQDRKSIIERLYHCEQGYGQDDCHPRFIQIMLRLGDLLDLDNNRFNVFQLQLFGELPFSSKAHIEKHKSVKHLNICTDFIEVSIDMRLKDDTPDTKPEYLMLEAKASNKLKRHKYARKFANENKDASDLIEKLRNNPPTKNPELLVKWKRLEEAYIDRAKTQREACRICAKWFDMLEKELDFWSLKWSEIVPKSLLGSTPNLRKREISWQGRVIDIDTVMLEYSISHKRAASIIQGTGLYGDLSQNPGIYERIMKEFDKELVFIRELTQNAMDANKIQLFRYLCEDRYGDALLCFGNNISKWDPIEILTHVGEFMRNIKVEIRVYYETDFFYETDLNDCTEKNKRVKTPLRFEVRDVGTGIDNHTLKSMRNIGDSRNSVIQELIEKMPDWLRPNGAFGIGMQSVFGVVDEFSAMSGSRMDHKTRDLFFSSNGNNGDLFAAIRIDDGYESMRYGTRITVKLNENQFQHFEKRLRKDKNELCFNCHELFYFIGERIVRMLGNDLLPVVIKFFVDEIEVRNMRKTLYSVFSPFIKYYDELDAPYSNSIEKELGTVNVNNYHFTIIGERENDG